MRSTTETTTVSTKTSRTAQADNAPRLFAFSTTPTGPLLRAYFIALAMAQLGGKLLANRRFRLWDGANLQGHVAAGRMKAHKNNVYSFTAAGTAYFKGKRQPSPNLLKHMSYAVVTGRPPKDYYNSPMQPM